jgi:hypothetical protein
MDFENAVVVANFATHAMAEAAVSLLGSENIEAVISSDDAGGELPNLGVGGKVRVLVQSKDEQFARGLLTQGEAT